MKEISEFKELLYDTIIDSICTDESARNKMKALQEWIITNIPRHLYRFRSCTNYAIDALKNDEIWGSKICEFNDPYECTPFYNYDTLQKTVQHELSFENIFNQINLLKEGNISARLEHIFDKETIRQMIDNAESTLENESILKKKYKRNKKFHFF